MVSALERTEKSTSFGACFCTPNATALLFINFIFNVMQKHEKITASPVQTKNEQTEVNTIISRVLQNQSSIDRANANIRKHYKKQKKEVIINDLIQDFQAKFDYENFIEELGLSTVFESWQTLNFIREEVSNG